MENTRAAPCILHNADTAATKHKNRRDRPGGFLSLLSPRRRARRRAAAPVKQTGSSASNAKRAPRSMLRGARQLFSIGSQLGSRMSLRSTSAARPTKQAPPVSRGPRGKLHFLGGSESRLRQDLDPRPRCLCAADAAPVLRTGGRGPQLGFRMSLRSTSAASFHRRSSS